VSSRQSGVGTRSSRQLDSALLVAEQLKRPILRMPNKEEVAAMDKLIAEVASPRTKRVLADYKQEGKVCILHMNSDIRASCGCCCSDLLQIGLM